jgi:adenine-specific DNA-methyltransferase
MTHQILPRSGAKRESLRQKGQFWTPGWVADAMVSYVLGGGATHVFDPAVGEGAFWSAAKRVGISLNRKITLLGTEIDSDLVEQKLPHHFSKQEMKGISIGDFLFAPPEDKFDAIVANPPYIRHHRLSPECKTGLKEFIKSLPGCHIDGRAGLHIYFLLRALLQLNKKGHLAFIVPADTFEGVFAKNLWEWISFRYRIEMITTFTAKATPFPGVDTNAVVVCISHEKPREDYYWAQCSEAGTERLAHWFGGNNFHSDPALAIEKRKISDWVHLGLSRPNNAASDETIPLGDIVRVMRGVATGANEFFFLTDEQVSALKIPENFLLRAIGRTRDINGLNGAELTDKDISRLSNSGRPTFLFNADGRELNEFPASVRNYLLHGEELGLQNRSLISTRRPWYKMERRSPPPFLFAYLGRRNVRFIRNLAGVIPLTGFLCVYPTKDSTRHVDEIWRLLSHPDVLGQLNMVGKTYGGGAIKVEPRSLEKLPIPIRLLSEIGLVISRKLKYQNHSFDF